MNSKNIYFLFFNYQSNFQNKTTYNYMNCDCNNCIKSHLEKCKCLIQRCLQIELHWLDSPHCHCFQLSIGVHLCGPMVQVSICSLLPFFIHVSWMKLCCSPAFAENTVPEACSLEGFSHRCAPSSVTAASEPESPLAVRCVSAPLSFSCYSCQAFRSRLES